MKTLKLCILIIFCTNSVNTLFAQNPADQAPTSPPIPVEVFVTKNDLNFQMIISKPFEKDSKFSFFNVTAFKGDFDNKKNEYITQGLVNYDFFKGLAISAGATMHYRTGFRPTAGLTYTFANRTWLLVVLPRFDLTEDKNFETFGLLEYKPQLTDKLGLYTRIQGLYNYNTNFEFHDRSYVYLRAGLSYKSYQFGLGANFDTYGPRKIKEESYGLFVRAQLFN